jgi:arabinogalactan endo-1,4-beta-galactosidase
MKKPIQLIFLLLSLCSCDKEKTGFLRSDTNDLNTVSVVDISSYPEIALTNPVFYDQANNPKDFLDIIKQSGVNTIRLRLWVDPINDHSGLNEVKQFSKTLKSKGFKTWLTLHYSDTWADPGHQQIPKRWESISYLALRDSVNSYTQKVVRVMEPDFIQIGNEINSGLLLPEGDITRKPQQFKELMNDAILAVRSNKKDARIIIHYAGTKGSDWFFNQVKDLDYDIIGLSYYPLWHGKSLDGLKLSLQQLSQTYNKDILIAETAYPFTLNWNDWTNNIVGLNEQLILPEFPASPDGQMNFIKQIKKIVLEDVNRGIGFCYWGGELVAWKGG